MYVPDATSPKQPLGRPRRGRGPRDRHRPNLADFTRDQVSEGAYLGRMSVVGYQVGAERPDRGTRLAGKTSPVAGSTGNIGLAISQAVAPSGQPDRAFPNLPAPQGDVPRTPTLCRLAADSKGGLVACLLLAALFIFKPIFVLLTVGHGSAV